MLRETWALFFFRAEDGIRDGRVTGVQTCALPIFDLICKAASVYIDGGFADKVEKAKKFALRPGNHDIELRDSDGRTLYREKVAVTIGKKIGRASCRERE